MKRTSLGFLVGVALTLGIATLIARSAPPARPSARPRVTSSPAGASPSVSPVPGETLDAAGRDPGDARFSARARSVQTSGAIEDLRRVVLSGELHAAASVASFKDAHGKDYGAGSLSIWSGRVATNSRGTSLRAGSLIVRPGYAVIGRYAPGIPGGGDTKLILGPTGTIESTNISFTPASTSKAVTLSGTFAFEAPNGEPLELGLGTDEVRWLNPPATIPLVHDRGRSSISWDGPGTIRWGTRVAKTTTGGVFATWMDATVKRTSSTTLSVSGTATYTQIFVNGRPMLRTSATVDVLGPPKVYTRPEKGWFAWAPRNLGAYDMTITRIRPGNATARWINIALERLPAMAGGTRALGIGGTTTGFSSDSGNWFGHAVGLRSVLPIDDADRRDISYDIPQGTAPGTYTMVLILEGNFEPVTVRISFRVR